MLKNLASFGIQWDLFQGQNTYFRQKRAFLKIFNDFEVSNCFLHKYNKPKLKKHFCVIYRVIRTRKRVVMSAGAK